MVRMQSNHVAALCLAIIFFTTSTHSCLLRFRARFADADASTTTISVPITKTEFAFVLEYQTDHENDVWAPLRWDNLSPVHTSRVHVAILSQDKVHFIHVHPEDFASEGLVPNDSDTVVKIKAHFPSSQRYAMVIDWTALVDSLTSTCSELEDELYYNGSQTKLAEAHQLLAVQVIGDGEAESRPLLESHPNPQRLHSFKMHEWDTSTFMNLAESESFCCDEDNRDECVETHLVHLDSPVPSYAKTDRATESKLIRVVPMGECISFGLFFEDKSTGLPAELSPILEAAAHVLIVNEDLTVGIHLHEIVPGAQLKSVQDDDECPHGDKVLAKGPDDEIGALVEIGALLPTPGIWTMLATTSYMDKVVVSKFDIIVAPSEAEMEIDTCLDMEPECASDLSCEDYKRFQGNFEWVWEADQSLYESGTIGSMFSSFGGLLFIVVPSAVVALVVLYWCRTNIKWLCCICFTQSVVVDRTSSSMEQIDVENVEQPRSRRNSLTVVTEAFTRHRRNSQGYFEPLEAAPDTPGTSTSPTKKFNQFEDPADATDLGCDSSTPSSPNRKTNRRSTLAIPSDAAISVQENRLLGSDTDETAALNNSTVRQSTKSRRNRRRRSIGEAVVEAITRQQRHSQGYLNPSEDQPVEEMGPDEDANKEDLAESLDWIARV